MASVPELEEAGMSAPQTLSRNQPGTRVESWFPPFQVPACDHLFTAALGK